MIVADWLAHATTVLTKNGVTSARLDALILLSDALDHDKGWVLAHGEEVLATEVLSGLTTVLTRRSAREPLAYIRGVQEFYGRELRVTTDVLVPRPETESLIELLKTPPMHPHARLIDVGTGSGAIAITAALEFPELEVTAADVSTAALAVAVQNSQRLGARVHFLQQSLLGPSQAAWHFIVANLPYVDRSWQRSPETQFEPGLALFADNDGLALILQLVTQAANCIVPGGHLLLEADPRQHQTIIAHAKVSQFSFLGSDGFALALRHER